MSPHTNASPEELPITKRMKQWKKSMDFGENSTFDKMIKEVRTLEASSLAQSRQEATTKERERIVNDLGRIMEDLYKEGFMISGLEEAIIRIRNEGNITS